MQGKIKGCPLLSWYWSINSINNERFSHFQLKAHLPHPSFSKKTLINHLQLHLTYFNDSRFKNDIGRTLVPNKPIWNSNFLDP